MTNFYDDAKNTIGQSITVNNQQKTVDKYNKSDGVSNEEEEVNSAAADDDDDDYDNGDEDDDDDDDDNIAYENTNYTSIMMMTTIDT
jgi:hypothetical protein